jgi:hypothetical protein
MKIDMASADDKYKATLSKEIIDRYFRSEIAGRIFNNVVLYCCSPKPTDDGLTMDWVLRKAKYEQLQLALMKLEFDGGQVVSAVTDEVTHVIVPDKDDSAHLKHLTNVFKR